MIHVLGRVKKDDVDNEVRALKKLCQNQHPNIVQVFDYGQLHPDSTIYYIDMELCDISLAKYLSGGELKDVVSWATVREEEEVPTHAYNILQQILNGLVYIHCMGEVHRDLSPHNGMCSCFPPGLYLVLFRNGFWKIADFGLTSTGTSKKLITTSAGRGKDSYRAPELLRDSEPGYYNNKSDMWSFGCIAFELLAGRKAFSNDFEVWNYGVAKRNPKMYFKGLDDLAKYYLSGLLEVDPEKRPSARALLKEKFLTETPSAESSEAVRAQKRRRTTLTTSLATSTEPSSFLKGSFEWAVSNRQLDMVLGLMEAGLKPVNSSEVYAVLDAFRADWNASSYIRLGRFMNLYEDVGFISKTETLESDDPVGHGKLSRTLWSMSPTSRDWHAICANNLFDISHVHTDARVPSAEWQFSADGRYLASSSFDKMELYELTPFLASSNHSLATISIGFALTNIRCVRFTHNSSYVIVANKFGKGVLVWDLAASMSKLQLELSETYHLSSIDVSRDDTRLVGLSMNINAGSRLTLWNLDTGEIMNNYELSLGAPGFCAVVLSADGHLAMWRSYRNSNSVRVKDLHAVLPDVELEGHQGWVHSIACSHTNPQQVISGSYDQSVKLWTLPTPEFWPGNQFPASISSPPYSYLVPSGILTMTFTGHHRSVSTVAFSPDDRWIASGSFDGSVRFWNPSDGSLVLLLYGHTGKSG